MKYRDRRALAEQELKHRCAIHAELFSLLIKLEELRDYGRADYSFRNSRRGQPCVSVSIFLSNKKDSIKTWEVPLPMSEEVVGQTIAALDKITGIVAQEEVKKKELAKQALLSKLTPEEIKLLTNTDPTYKYET